MKRLKRWLLPVFTLLLVAAGAAMPFAVSYVQDAREAGAETRSFDAFRLTLKQEADLSQILRMVAGSDYFMEEDRRSENAVLTETGALEAAGDVMAALFRHGALEAEYYESLEVTSIWPQTMISKDGSVSIATWTVQWEAMQGDVPGAYIWMDDATGKAFLISVPSVIYSSDYINNVSSEAIYAAAENWRAFLADYYGTEVSFGNEMWFDGTARFALTFSLGASENGEQTEFQLDLYIYSLDGFTTLSPYVDPYGPLSNASTAS